MSRIGTVRDSLPAMIILGGIRSTPVDVLESSFLIHFLMAESVTGVKSKFSFNSK